MSLSPKFSGWEKWIQTSFFPSLSHQWGSKHLLLSYRTLYNNICVDTWYFLCNKNLTFLMNCEWISIWVEWESKLFRGLRVLVHKSSPKEIYQFKFCIPASNATPICSIKVINKKWNFFSSYPKWISSLCWHSNHWIWDFFWIWKKIWKWNNNVTACEGIWPRLPMRVMNGASGSTTS